MDLFAHFFHYPQSSDSVPRIGRCLDSCLPGIILYQLCSVATAQPAPLQVYYDHSTLDGGGGLSGWLGGCWLCNMVQ